MAIGFLMHIDLLAIGGILLAAHSSFDGMLGYGSKYSDDFKHTRSGWMGKKSQA